MRGRGIGIKRLVKSLYRFISYEDKEANISAVFSLFYLIWSSKVYILNSLKTSGKKYPLFFSQEILITWFFIVYLFLYTIWYLSEQRFFVVQKTLDWHHVSKTNGRRGDKTKEEKKILSSRFLCLLFFLGK